MVLGLLKPHILLIYIRCHCLEMAGIRRQELENFTTLPYYGTVANCFLASSAQCTCIPSSFCCMQTELEMQMH